MLLKRMARVICVMALLGGAAFSQSTTGSMTGTVVDSSNAAVPGAQVEAKSLRTGAVRQTVSGPEGLFDFNSLVPDRYNLTIKATGFKTYTQSNIDIAVDALRDLGKLPLALGALTEEISVTAAATPVQTASSEKSSLVDSDQMVDLTLKGRDLFAVLQTVPGVNMGTTYLTGGDATNEGNGLGALQINGGGSDRANFTVDGVTDMDTGNEGQTHFEPTMDSIAEIRVLTTNYQAEYGRKSSGDITVVTKGGSQQFHGSAYVNKRHEMFNANTFFHNEANTPKSVYRFFVYGYSVGGPVYIPKVWNTQKKKLFFFFSQEYTKQKPATLTGTYGVPTSDIGANGTAISGMSPGMMQGQFYSTCQAGSSPCVPAYTNGNGTNEDSMLLNPSANKAILTGGNLNSLIGTQYYDATSAAYGQAILGFLPPPNMCTAAAGIYNGAAISPTNCPAGFTTTGISPTNNYTANYYTSFNETHPRRNDTVRLDWNITSKLTTWGRYINDFDLDDASLNIDMKTASNGWQPFTAYHPNPGHGWGIGITYTISPTMVNEFTFGKSYNTWDYYPRDDSQLARANMGNPPSFDNFATDPNFVNDKGNNRPDMATTGSQNFFVGVPQASFGGQPTESAAGTSSCGGQCPYTNYNDIYSFNDAISKVMGKHNLKAGIYIERSGKVQHDDLGSPMGYYTFGSGGAPMAADTQDGFANAYLGNMNNYAEGGRNIGNWWFTNIEYFVQDNWRVSPRLTLDLGMRFYYIGPTTNLNTGENGAAEFLPSAYNVAAAPRIYLPGCTISTTTGSCPSADQYAIDPGTGYKTFYAYQGALVPAAVGGYSTPVNLYDGMVQAGTGSLPLSLYTVKSVSPTPRIGFAWDVFGTGRTAVRGGFGLFLNQPDFNLIQYASEQQPVMQNRSAYYTTINSLNSAAIQASAAIQPIAPGTDFYGQQKYESAYNGSFMIQQNLGFSTVLEASWVFNLRRNIPSNRQINYTPLYAQYNPSWASPMAQYLTVQSKIGGITQGNVNGLDLSSNYFYGPSLCAGCVSGFGGLYKEGFNESADYNALQITLRRNMTKHLSYQLSYTYSKTMSIGQSSLGDGSNGAAEDAIFPDKFRNWGASYNPTPQVATINYVYEAPNLGQKLNFKPLGWVTDHWTWSGITQIHSDLMYGVPGYTLSNSNGTSDPLENWTGGSDGARMFVTGNYRLSSIGQSVQYNGLGAASVGVASTPIGAASQEVAGGVSPTYTTTSYPIQGSAGNQIINQNAFQIPFPCSATPAANPVYGVGESMECLGNAGPGSLMNIPNTRVFNFDMTFSKNFPLKSEKRVLMFRAEMYNIFNHTQFNGANTGPSYDWNNWKNGVLVETANNVGRYTGTLNPRQMSMSLRLQF